MDVLESTNVISLSYKEDVFTKYLSELYSDLLTRVQGSHHLLQFPTFHHFINLPMIISEKLFGAFNILKENGLTQQNFIRGFKHLYCGSIKKRFSLIFQIFDFNSDGYVSKEDILLLLNRFHLSQKSKIATEIKEIICNFFGMEETLSRKEFLKRSKYENSDLILLFLFLIRQAKSLHQNSLLFFIQHAKGLMDTQYAEENKIPNLSNPNDFTDVSDLAQPSEILMLYIKQYIDSSMSYDEDDLRALDIFESDINLSTQSSVIRKLSFDPPKVLSIPEAPLTPSRKPSSDFEKKLNQINFFVSRSVKLQKQSRISETKTCSALSSGSTLVSDEKQNVSIFDFGNEWLCYIFQNGTLSKCKLVLVEQDLFCFLISTKMTLVKIYNLRHSFIKNGNQAKINNNVYFQATLHTNTHNPQSLFFFDLPKDRENFIKAIKIATNRNITLRDKYEILQQIGKGAFGRVFKAVNKKTQEIVAIKTLKKDQNQVPFILWERDVFIFLTQINHPNIIRAIEYFESANKISFIYEFIDGGHLGNFLSNQHEYCSANQVLGILSQVGKAVSFLHEYGIIHRDIKPENILIEKKDKDLIYKLIDFGFAKTFGLHEKAYEPYGTFCFAAPEILTGGGYNHNVDVWSFGVLAYYLYYARLPFDDYKKDINFYINAKLVDKDNGLIKGLIKNCLVKDSSHRPCMSHILKSEIFDGLF